MKLSNKKKNIIKNCILLTITGNTIAYMNNYYFNNIKKKKIC